MSPTHEELIDICDCLVASLSGLATHAGHSTIIRECKQLRDRLHGVQPASPMSPGSNTPPHPLADTEWAPPPAPPGPTTSMRTVTWPDGHSTSDDGTGACSPDDPPAPSPFLPKEPPPPAKGV
jgi:hypothetical protein